MWKEKKFVYEHAIESSVHICTRWIWIVAIEKEEEGKKENWGLWTGNCEKNRKGITSGVRISIRKNEMEKISAKVLLIQSIDHNLYCVLHFAQHNAIISSESKSHQTWSRLVNPPDCSLFVSLIFINPCHNKNKNPTSRLKAKNHPASDP